MNRTINPKKSVRHLAILAAILLAVLIPAASSLTGSAERVYAENNTVHVNSFDDIMDAVKNAGETPTTIILDPSNRYYATTVNTSPHYPPVVIEENQNIRIKYEGDTKLEMRNPTKTSFFKVRGTLAIEGPSSDLLVYTKSISGTEKDNRFAELEGTGKLTLSGITISGAEGTSAIIKRNPAGRASLILGKDTVLTGNDGGTYPGAIMVYNTDVTIDGAIIKNNKGNWGTINLDKGSSLVMNSGEISGNDINGSGGAISAAGSNVEINGGKINNNTTNGNGGGIYAGPGGDDNKGSEVTINGGEISGNTAQSFGGGISISDSILILNDGTIDSNNALYGGGIYATNSANVKEASDNCRFDFNGGTISNNKAISDGGKYELGGGICISGKYVTFHMNDGKIINNYAGETAGYTGSGTGYGGGIYINSSYSFLHKGEIKGNESTAYGGGIYISGVPIVAHFEKTVVKNNTASWQGGGVWLCPTGAATLDANDGMAIFDNAAKGNTASSIGGKAIGDDIVIQSEYTSNGKSKKDIHITLSERMLGGGQVDYYHDGEVEPRTWEESGAGEGSNGDLVWDGDHVMPSNNTVDRYTTGSKTITSLTDINSSLALKTILSDNAKALADECGTLVISDNVARGGGGIGSNGSFDIRTEEGDPEIPKEESDVVTYTLQVTKKWIGFAQNELPKSVNAQLVIDDKELDVVELTAENNWTGEFTGLPDLLNIEDRKGNKLTINLEEKLNDRTYNVKYEVEYEDIIKTGETKFETSMINTKMLVLPDDQQPTLKVKDVTENGGSKTGADGDKNVDEKGGNGSSTGDRTPLMLIMLALMISVISSVIIIGRVRSMR